MSFLYDGEGNRKYATEAERTAVLRLAKATAPPAVYTYCLVLVLTGARISEVLELTPRHIDLDQRMIVVRSLKKRNRTRPIYRAIPVPSALLHALDTVHDITSAGRDPERMRRRIWPWCRTTGWSRLKELFDAAGIAGPQATPKGFRHGFAVGALLSGVPLNVLQKWMGHEKIETTAIYGEVIGPEERSIAERMWGVLPQGDHRS